MVWIVVVVVMLWCIWVVMMRMMLINLVMRMSIMRMVLLLLLLLWMKLVVFFVLAIGTPYKDSAAIAAGNHSARIVGNIHGLNGD